MPKQHIKIAVGNRIASELKGFLESYFSAAQLGRLERLGGRITISFAAPYREKSIKAQPEISSEFIETLRANRGEPEKLRGVVEVLSGKKLSELCIVLEIPVRSNATRSEMMSQVMQTVQANEVWLRISSPDREPEVERATKLPVT